MREAAVPDMPFEDFLRAMLPLKDVYRPDSITVAITGGEPLMREDLAQCGRTLREHGFRWGMVTNGYGYTPAIHEQLLAAGMGSVTVSLDGLQSTHNWLRMDDQSFDRAVSALELIAASPRLIYDVVTCVNKKNINELEQIKELLITKQTVAWRLFTIAPIGRAAHNSDLILSPAQLQQLMDFIVRSRADKRIKTNFSCEAYLGEYEREARDAFFFCRAGIQIASVLIDGSISACPNIDRHFVQGNICRDSFLDVWNNRFEVMRDRRWTKTGICRNCKDYRNCHGGAMHLWNERRDSIMTCIHHHLTHQ
jgi:radical SAM enzyme (rSAM/lipoprotein system)